MHESGARTVPLWGKSSAYRRPIAGFRRRVKAPDTGHGREKRRKESKRQKKRRFLPPVL